MKLQQMGLSEQSLGKLSQLAMAVELQEHKRFSVRKDIDQVVGLLKYASACHDNTVQKKLDELTHTLSADCVGFFRTLGVRLQEPTAPAAARQTYRGQVMTKTPAPATTQEQSASAEKKKIIYRGKVIYR